MCIRDSPPSLPPSQVTGLMRSPDTSSEMTVVRSTPEVPAPLTAPDLPSFMDAASFHLWMQPAPIYG
eukprot:3903077-Rhodomonas_salina.1